MRRSLAAAVFFCVDELMNILSRDEVYTLETSFFAIATNVRYWH